MERDNRKSHLAPQLSPATQQLLRSSDESPISSSQDYSSLPTPTSGDIPIGGSAITSPYNNQSPIKNGTASLGRASGAPFHPGLPPRVATTNSVPKLSTLNAPDNSAPSGSSSANASTATFNLPMRPAPPAGPLPPPPVPRKENGDTKDRRQATFGGNSLYSGYNGH